MSAADEAPPLRACLLSGGASRRMGSDKALLPHCEGGSWLEHTLRLLLQLEIPVTLLSRHPSHLQLARTLNAAAPAGDEAAEITARPGKGALPAPTGAPGRGSALLHAFREPAPWEGPLLALQRLMQRHPDERLLLAPVDMPFLTTEALGRLVEAAAAQPAVIHLAHDGERRQPLLGIYPSDAARRIALAGAIQAGERRLLGWLADQACLDVHLAPDVLRNINRSAELPSWARATAAAPHAIDAAPG